MGQATFMAVRWHIQKVKETLRSYKDSKVLLWSFWFFFFSKCWARTIFTEPISLSFPNPSPPASILQIQEIESPFIKARVFIQSQGNKFAHYEIGMDSIVHRMWSGEKCPSQSLNYINSKHFCFFLIYRGSNSILEGAKTSLPALSTSGKMWRREA